MVQSDRQHEDFTLTYFLLVFGKLNERAEAAFDELKREYALKNVKLILHQMEQLIDEFLVGSSKTSEEINLLLRIPRKEVLRARDYCYFLANAGDLFRGFQKYGWRLFDLNLRYEVRNSAVNADIVESLSNAKKRSKFHQLNNGLIIVASNYAIPPDQSQIRLVNAQIVNGLQTVKSIYNAVTEKEVSVQDLENDCVVQVKAIQTSDQGFVASVVRATNNQNPMSARNLRANAREQKTLRKAFAALSPRWFLQVKEGEWESLSQEGGKFFKEIVGFPPMEFKPDPAKKRGRMVDNQDVAKAWLAFIGFADLAGDRVTHFFGDEHVYKIAFTMSPTPDHWNKFKELVDFAQGREDTLKPEQGYGCQYMLAYLLWQFVRCYIPSPQRYREEALEEGHKAGKLQKSGGVITSPPSEQEKYLATNHGYQTWRVMANMKELLVEAATQVLLKRYGPLEPELCDKLLQSFEFKEMAASGETRSLAESAASANDLPADAVASRILGFLRHVSGQFFEEKEKQLQATSRLRTVLLKREMAADFKQKLVETEKRKSLDTVWKPMGKAFVESLPPLG